MEIRDAVEADAPAVARLVDGHEDVVRNLIHDRTVRLAVDGDEIVACVSFDARPGTVYVTQLGGDPAACECLLNEPVQFARREDMVVELLAPDGDEAAKRAAAAVGFDRDGEGPTFDGVPTIRYRYHPD